MARPSPTLIASGINERGRVIDIIATDKTYAVVYDGRTISIRRDTGYSRVFFAHPAHAHREAAKMNALFATDLFTVREMVIA